MMVMIICAAGRCSIIHCYDVLILDEKCMATCRVRTEFAHTQPYPCIRFEPRLVQHLRRLARRPFSPMGGERFDRTVSYCMQHDRMPGPEVERPDLPFEYGRFEDSTDS